MYDAIISGQVNTVYSRVKRHQNTHQQSTRACSIPDQGDLFGQWKLGEQLTRPEDDYSAALSEDNIEFFVAADTFLNDTTEYADIVLPSTHWFENDDIVSGYMHPYLLDRGESTRHSLAVQV